MKFKRILTAVMAMILLLSVFSVFASAAPATISTLRGDVDGDGKLSKRDYMVLKAYFVSKKTQLDEYALARSDVNKNGRVEKTDYMLLKSYFFGKYSISGDVTFKTAIDKIVDVAGGKGKSISRDFTGIIGSAEAKATVTFEVSSKGQLSLEGEATTKQGMVLEISIPLSAVAETYSFSGDAVLSTTTGSCEGTITAKTYSYFDLEIEDISFKSSIELPGNVTSMLGSYCKEAMDQFLYNAHLLLSEKNAGVTIGDLGFTTFQGEIDEGWLED